MGDWVIGLPGAEFDLSVLKVELDVITVVEFVTAGRTNIELEVLTPVPVPQPPVKIIIKRSCVSKTEKAFNDQGFFYGFLPKGWCLKSRISQKSI